MSASANPASVSLILPHPAFFISNDSKRFLSAKLLTSVIGKLLYIYIYKDVCNMNSRAECRYEREGGTTRM